jgi:hypothetical protein
MPDSGTPSDIDGSSIQFRDGDRCSSCLCWFWESDGLWHSLVPRRFFDAKFGPKMSEVRYVSCGSCK